MQNKLAVYLLIAATITFWGGSYVAARLLTPGLDVVVLSCARVAIAFIVLLSLCLANKVKLLPDNKKTLGIFVLLGFVGIFMYTVFFQTGIQTVPGGRASVIINVNPMLIAIGAALFLREKLTPIKICGVLLAGLGAAIVISHGHLSALFTNRLSAGDVWMLAAAASTAGFALLGKVILQKGYRPIQIITLAVFFGLICFIPSALATGNARQVFDYTLRDWLCVIYLGMFSTALAYILYYKILNKLGATGGGVIGSMIPIPAIFFTSLLLHEPLSVSLLAGAIITVAGVLLVNLAPKNVS